MECADFEELTMKLPPNVERRCLELAGQSAPKLSEKEFMAAVVALAKRNGFLVYHTYDSRKSEPGFLDLTMVRGCLLIFAELKTDEGQLTAAQRNWYEALAQTFARVYVWRPRDWARIEEVLA